MKYILLIDQDDDILNIQTMVLSSFYGGTIRIAHSGKAGLEIIQKKGEPELIVSDQSILEEESPSLYHHIKSENLLIPLIICSGSVSYDFHERKFPEVSAFVQKPFSIESLSYLVKSITNVPLKKPDYIAVKLPILLNFIGKSFDLYLKLSDSNYVKVVKHGEPFTKDDSEKMTAKGITHLHISALDGVEFLRSYEENLNLLLASKVSDVHKIALAIDSLEAISTLARGLGWTDEVQVSTQKSIDVAIKILSIDANIVEVLGSKLSRTGSSYSRHVGMLCYLCCAFSDGLGWGGDSAKMKLTLAALLHDIAVEENAYDDIKNWNLRAANFRDRSPEVIKYRLHPIEASKMVQKIQSLPPDVETILLQHHEKKDGSGFPRSLTSSRITGMAAYFMIVEELVEFIGDGENLETSLTDFITWGDAYYENGMMKDIFKMIRARLIPVV
jgi:CheY-like chemotaxis protein